MEIPERIAKKLFEYQNRYLNNPSEVKKELSDKIKNEVATYIEHFKKYELKDNPETTQKQIIERLLLLVEKDIKNNGKYAQWMEQISENELKVINEEVEDYIKNTIERNEKIEDTVMIKFKQKARHYEFLDYLSMHDNEALSILKDELIKLKEQIRTGKTALEEQDRDTKEVQPIKDITPLKPLMNTTNENEFIVVVNSIYDLVKYDNENTPDKMKVRFTAYLLFHKGWLVNNIGNQNAYIDIILNYFGYTRTTKDEKNFKFHLIKKNEFEQNKTKYMAIFNLLKDKENKTKSTEPL